MINIGLADDEIEWLTPDKLLTQKKGANASSSEYCNRFVSVQDDPKKIWMYGYGCRKWRVRKKSRGVSV